MSHVGYHSDAALAQRSSESAINRPALTPSAAIHRAAPPPQTLSAHSTDLPFDRQQLLDRCLGNLAFAERLLASFERRFVEDVANIEQSLATRDTAELVRVAHQLKGASANMSAPRLQRVAAEIENHGRADRLESIAEQLIVLRQEWEYFARHRASQDTNQSLEEPRR